jgi:hypothetical protein
LAARRKEGRSVRFLTRSQTRSHRFPDLLACDPSRMVTLYAEGTSRSARQESCSLPREALYLCLERPFTAQPFTTDFVIRTQQKPAAHLLERLAITDEQLHTAVDRRLLGEQLQSLLAADDIVCVWNQSSARILQELGVDREHVLLLKGAYSDYLRYLFFSRTGSTLGSSEQTGLDAPAPVGDLEDVLQRHQISGVFPWSLGRGAFRLSQTTAILKWLIEQSSAGAAQP